MWCTIINSGLLMFWAVIFMSAPDLVYRIQSKFFPISRENFEVVLYSLLGFFKMLVIVFNLVPWLALLIIE